MMSLTVLALLCLLQAWSSSTQFVFEFELESVTTIFDNGTCDSALPGDVKILGPCEPFLSTFCLREGTSTQNSDTGYCPLGRNDEGIIAYTPGLNLTGLNELTAATRPGLPDGSVNRTITSQDPWPGAFQLYIEARELDPCCFMGLENVYLDGIFINETLEVNAGFTPIETYNGTSMRNRVVLDMRFRVICQQDYYGPDCTRLCRAQNDSVNGYYTCNSDGSIQCWEGFRNPRNNCTEAILACDSSPCANDGSCTSMGAFNFTCQCAVGYTGSTCEVNIDDCMSATCPSNSMCVNGVNSYECTCLPGFMDVNGSCVLQTEISNTDDVTVTSIPGAVGRSAVAAIGGGVGGALVVIIILIIIVVVLILLYQGQHEKDNSAHQLDEKLPPTTAIYATPSSPEASVIKLENPVYGEIEDDTNVHDFQNPVYGDAEDNSAQQDELYTAPQPPQPVSLGMEGDGPEYDYATNPGAGAVTVNMKTNGSTLTSRNSKMAELDVTEPYERLHHGTEPLNVIRLAEVEGAEYGSLQ